MPRGIRRSVEATQALGQTPVSGLEQPAVSSRAAETRRERRRRNDGDLDRMASMKLAVPRELQEQLQREGKVYRWILDTSMHEAHANDWDAVEGVTPVQANPREGTAERLVLCSKYADWHSEDVQRDASVVDQREQQLMEGQVSDGSRSSSGLHVPKSQANRVTTQRGL